MTTKLVKMPATTLTTTTPTSDRSWCSRCRDHKPASAFAINRSRSTGLQGNCRECSKAIFREWNARKLRTDQDYRDRRHKSDREYRARNPAKFEAIRISKREKYQVETYGKVIESPEELVTLSKDRYKVARALGYRSGLEVKNAAHIEANGYPVHYETGKIKYTVPARLATYSPDFPLLHNGIVVETKGVFVTADRQKSILIKNEYPDLDLRFVFSNPAARISKTSATTYAMWCQKFGFQYAKQLIPLAWLNEPPEPRRVAAMKAALVIKS
jgi:hypothetical protein